jgi:hypothetical protein
MQLHLDDGFTEKLIFSNEAMFHFHGKGNRHDVHIWGTENPHAAIEHIQDSLKLNICCAISNKKVYRPFFFVKSTVIGTSYLNMMKKGLMPQVEDDSDDFIYQKDGALPYYYHLIHSYLNQRLPKRWIGCTTTED